MQLKCLIFMLSLWKSAQNMPHLNLVLGYSPNYPYYQLFSYNLNYIKNQQTTPILENKVKEEKTGFTIAQGQSLISFDFRQKPKFGISSTDSPGSESTPNLIDRLPTTEQSSLSLSNRNMEPDKPNSPKNFSQTKTPEASTGKASDNISQTKPSMNLENQEMKPSFLPKPGNNIDQIASNKPKPNSPDDYDNDNQFTPTIIDRLSENGTEKPINKIVKTQRKPTISLEYKPMRPFYAGTNGFSIGQIVQPGQPWPADPEGYQTFSQTTTSKRPFTVTQPNLDNRVKEPTTENNIEVQEETINIEYKPMRPFFAGDTGFSIGQIVQPGQPWPANAEDYQNFSQTTSPKLQVTSPKPNLDNRVQEPATENNETAQETINIEYKPMRPFFAGDTGFSIGQIVQPGQPWPASEEGYQNFSQTSVKPTLSVLKPNLNNRVQETLSGNNKTAQGEMRPFFAGSSGFSVGQIVPPGKPWPGSAEDYQNFSQTTPNLGNRVQATTSSSNQEAQEQVVSLEYKPMRPFHYPKPTTVGQVVSTGKPWPVSLEGYQNFTEVKPGVVVDRFQESSTSEAQAGFIWEEDVIVQPRPNSVLYTSKPGQEGAITTEGALFTSSILEGKAVSETGMGKSETLKVSVLPLKMPFISVAASND